MLTHPNGNLMLLESIYGLDLKNVNRIIITVVKSHIEDSKIDLQKISDKIYQNKGIVPEFLILDEFTSSQSETVYLTIKNKELTDHIFIKDCDNYFSTTIQNQDSVCISHLKPNVNACNKSYVSLNKYGFVSGIVEKKIVGDKFCVGGYSFSNATLFKEAFEKLSQLHLINSEIYISHIIQELLINYNVSFSTTEVSDYFDWGTIEDWQKYTSQFKTMFIDIDGVLVKNSSEFFQPEWGNSDGLPNNIDIIGKLFDSGKITIILTTARSEQYSKETIVQLKRLNVKYHKIIFGLPHAARVLINDYASSNVYPSAIAINVKRDADDLKDYQSYLSGRHNS